MPFREWNFDFRELFWEYPGTLRELREWPFHSKSVFPEIGVVPRLLIKKAYVKIDVSLRVKVFFLLRWGNPGDCWHLHYVKSCVKMCFGNFVAIALHQKSRFILFLTKQCDYVCCKCTAYPIQASAFSCLYIIPSIQTNHPALCIKTLTYVTHQNFRDKVELFKMYSDIFLCFGLSVFEDHRFFRIWCTTSLVYTSKVAQPKGPSQQNIWPIF